MKQGSIRKPAGWLAVVGLAAAGALALFAINAGGPAYAAGVDDSQNLAPGVFNAPGDWNCDHNGPPGNNGGNNGRCDDDCDRDWDHNGPPHRGGNNDDCDRDDDDCDNGWGGHGPPNRGGNNDRCDRDDDRDDCDRDWNRNSSPNRDRDRDDCKRGCDRDSRDRDRNRHRDCDRDRDDSEITIIKVASPSSSETFSFGGDLGSFTVRDGQSRSFRVDSGTYTVWENVKGDWDLQSVHCSGDGIATNQNDGVRIRVSDDDHVTCVFNNKAPTPVKVVSPAVAPQPQIIYVPVPAPAPQPVARPVEVVREPAPAPRPVQTVAALPRTGEGSDFQREGNLALPFGVLAALMVAGFGYVAVRRVRDND